MPKMGVSKRAGYWSQTENEHPPTGAYRWIKRKLEVVLGQLGYVRREQGSHSFFMLRPLALGLILGITVTSLRLFALQSALAESKIG